MNIKKLIIFIVVIVGGIIIYQQVTKPPDPLEARAQAQRTVYGCTKYFLDSVMSGNEADMLAVCTESAYGQAKSAVQALHEEEIRLGGTFDEYTCFTMGAAGSYKAILSSKGCGILMNMTFVARKEDGKYVIFNISQD
jgi:hypothetical protein